MLALGTVHTSGINFASYFAIVGSIVGIVAGMGAIAGLLASRRSKQMSEQITGAINQFRIDVINQLEHRLTSVENKVDTVNRNTRK